MENSKQELSRRELLKVSAVGVAAAAALGTGCASLGGVNKPSNAAFYNLDGSVDQDAVKHAYYQMMRRFNYPIPDFLRTENFWVLDFLQGDMATVGMGGVFWINCKNTYGDAGEKMYKGEFKEQKFGYLGHEIYLLPGQMLPEHSHIGGPDGYGPKMEAWQVRYGDVEFFGERQSGEETLIKNMPESERPWGYGEPWFKSTYVTKRTAQQGAVYVMNDAESWHFQRAGKDGAIVCEYATYHNHVRFSKPGMDAGNTAKKA